MIVKQRFGGVDHLLQARVAVQIETRDLGGLRAVLGASVKALVYVFFGACQLVIIIEINVSEIFRPYRLPNVGFIYPPVVVPLRSGTARTAGDHIDYISDTGDPARSAAGIKRQLRNNGQSDDDRDHA